MKAAAAADADAILPPETCDEANDRAEAHRRPLHLLRRRVSEAAGGGEDEEDENDEEEEEGTPIAPAAAMLAIAAGDVEAGGGPPAAVASVRALLGVKRDILWSGTERWSGEQAEFGII